MKQIKSSKLTLSTKLGVQLALALVLLTANTGLPAFANPVADPNCVDREMNALREQIRSKATPTSKIDKIKTGFIYGPSPQGTNLFISYVYQVDFAGGGMLPIPPSKETWAGQNTYDIHCNLLHEGMPAVVR